MVIMCHSTWNYFFKTPWRISGIAGILFVILSFIASGINILPSAYDQNKMILVAWFAVLLSVIAGIRYFIVILAGN